MVLLKQLKSVKMYTLQGKWRNYPPGKWNYIYSAMIVGRMGLLGVSNYAEEILQWDKSPDAEN